MVTRSYKKPAYEHLQFYKNICDIRRKIFIFTERLGKAQVRLVSQMRDSARSAKQNIREGYSKDSAGEFAHAIKISKGSLSELEGDLDDCLEDRLINEEENGELKELVSKTRYRIDRYLDSLYKLEQEGKWKSRFRRNP